MNINELIDEGIIAEDALKFESPSFDSAIIGVDYFGRLIYDYNVTDAMYYITEHNTEQELPDTITDSNHEEWKYVKTYIQTVILMLLDTI